MSSARTNIYNDRLQRKTTNRSKRNLKKHYLDHTLITKKTSPHTNKQMKFKKVETTSLHTAFTQKQKPLTPGFKNLKTKNLLLDTWKRNMPPRGQDTTDTKPLTSY